jgi:uncharacterized membrane protein YbaN (DUF454 family)
LGHLRIAALLGVLLTQSGCIELLLVVLDTTAAVGLTRAAMQEREKRQAAELADAKVFEK